MRKDSIRLVTSAIVLFINQSLGFGSSFFSFSDNLHIFSKKRRTPAMLLVFHGFIASKGPINISYRRRASAPKRSIMSSGLMTLPQRLLILRLSSAKMVPWWRSLRNGSSNARYPRSRSALVKKRAYSRCSTVCSAPPTYRSTGRQYLNLFWTSLLEICLEFEILDLRFSLIG